ncbi:hypothetical protein Tco_1023753 [Tanacetum coccineum]
MEPNENKEEEEVDEGSDMEEKETEKKVKSGGESEILSCEASFTALPFSEPTKKAISDMGFQHLTPALLAVQRPSSSKTAALEKTVLYCTDNTTRAQPQAQKSENVTWTSVKYNDRIKCPRGEKAGKFARKNRFVVVNGRGWKMEI